MFFFIQQRNDTILCEIMSKQFINQSFHTEFDSVCKAAQKSCSVLKYQFHFKLKEYLIDV